MDGREIISSASMLALDFAHGWVEDGRIFRVEISPSAGTYDFKYVFSIDGVKFEHMPSAPPMGGGNNSSSSSESTTRGFEQRGGKSGGGFDPFDESEPFGGGGGGTKVRAKQPQPEIDLFNDPVTPDAFTAPRDASFDPFASSGGNDPFSARPKSGALSHSELLALSNASAPSSDAFAASKPTATAAVNKPFEAFTAPALPKASSNNKGFDPFAAPAGPPNLAGLKLNAVAKPAEAEQPNSSQGMKKVASADLWDTGLVSLDITGKNVVKPPTVAGPPIGTFYKPPENKEVMRAPPANMMRPGPGPMGGGGMPPMGGNVMGGAAGINAGLPTFAFSDLMQKGYQPQHYQQSMQQQQAPKSGNPFDFRGL